MSENEDKPSAGYEIGRGKPPKHSRFPKGRSGNPGGRKKGSVNLKTVLRTVLESEIKLTEGGRARRVPMLEALVLRTAQEGLRGRLAAVMMLLDRYERLVGNGALDEQDLSEEDEQLLARVLGAARGAGPDQEGGAPAQTEEEAGDV